MIAAFLLGLLACATAAPHYYHHHHQPRFSAPGGPGYPSALDNYYGDGVFDMENFWMGLANEMHRIDEMLNDFSKNFPSSTSSQGIEGNDYVITITLTGFDEKDIIVKAREGLLVVQAVHKTEDGNQKTYMDIRTLPTNINVAGSWTYDKGVLKITFPLTKKPDDTTPVVTEEPITQVPASREEMDNNNDNVNQDADVGLDIGDVNQGSEILTNIIPRENRVEATTYAVDLKNEVEFVPVKY